MRTVDIVSATKQRAERQVASAIQAIDVDAEIEGGTGTDDMGDQALFGSCARIFYAQYRCQDGVNRFDALSLMVRPMSQGRSHLVGCDDRGTMTRSPYLLPRDSLESPISQVDAGYVLARCHQKQVVTERPSNRSTMSPGGCRRFDTHRHGSGVRSPTDQGMCSPTFSTVGRGGDKAGHHARRRNASHERDPVIPIFPNSASPNICILRRETLPATSAAGAGNRDRQSIKDLVRLLPYRELFGQRTQQLSHLMADTAGTRRYVVRPIAWMVRCIGPAGI